MDEIRQWFFETRTDETAKNLIKHGFEVIQVPDRRAACREALKRIPRDKTVGVGGSVTLREIGLIDQLRVQGNILYDHWTPGLTPEESLKTRKAQQSCDLYLSGSNAVTMEGEIVNVDGYGNRIASITFGPEEVIIVVGRNKIVKDIGAALTRIKEIAAPMNARRFGLKAPCAETGRCIDCDSPHRACRGTLILERRPFSTKMLVIIVQEDLGY